jgi:outer membrane protein assembly complex protein YaeT
MQAGTIGLRCAPTALAVLLACACAFAAEEAPPAATAPQPAGTTSEKAPEAVAEPLPAVARFRFVGNDHFSSRSLKRDLETRTGKPIAAKTLMADVDHIVARYADDGYLEAQVKATFEPTEGKAEKELLFTITEGRRFTLKSLEIVGNTVFSTEELRALAKAERDGYFTKGGFLDGAKHIWAHYGEVGRLTTVVEPQMGRRPAGNGAEVRYVIKEGPPVTLQAFSFRWVNTQVTAEWLLYREADRALTEGEPLTLAQIEKVVGRLKRDRWFKSVDYEIRPGAAPDRVVVVFVLEEGETSRLSLTGTAATYFGLSAALQFTESDFDITKPPRSWEDIEDWDMFRGRGEHLALSASPGQRLTTIGGAFVQPYTFGTDYNLVLNAQYTWASLPDWNEWQWQVRPGLTRELSEHWSAGFGPMLEGTEIWSISDQNVPDYREALGYTPGYGAWGQLSYATTPDTLIVNHGVRAGLMVEPMHEDTTFVKTTVSASRFFPVHGEGLDAHVLEVSGHAGQILGAAPFFDRFYCGGLGSVRGFYVCGISPLYDDQPIGGYYFTTGSAEYGFPLFHLYDEIYFRGALFVDAGDAETHLGDLDRIRVASGFGLRFVLPKFRGVTAGINLAWPLNSYHGDNTQVFTFFIGMGL